MSNIPTAEEFFDSPNIGLSYTTEYQYCQRDVKLRAIEFAKLHVEAALQIASKKADMLDDKECWRNCSCQHPCKVIDKDSILNAYPLENIK